MKKLSSLFVIMMFIWSLIPATVAGEVVPTQHDANITITPDVANCDELGATFTVNVENDASSDDNIFEVRIYEGTFGVVEFDCGPAPTGWFHGARLVRSRRSAGRELCRVAGQGVRQGAGGAVDRDIALDGLLESYPRPERQPHRGV